jgi:GAF domain-containing protein
MELANLPLIKDILNSPNRSAGDILEEVVTKIGETLKVDRCSLWVRDPSKEHCRTPFVWRRDVSIAGDGFDMKWVDEDSFVNDDPLYQAALACRPSIYITDVETTSSEILNHEFEAHYFGHRAFIHGHIVKDNMLWGTLEPCVFDHPREWTESEREFIEALLPLIANHVKEFVTKEQ